MTPYARNVVRDAATARPSAAHVAEPPKAERVDGLWLFVLFAMWMWIQTLWTKSPGHIEGAILFTKYSVLFFTIQQILNTPKALELFAWFHVAGCFMWGWIGFRSDVHGRFEMVLGPNVDDSNLLGFHLVTGLAFAGFLFLTSGGVKRWLALGALPFILNAIILTASRSALLGLVAAGMSALWLSPRTLRKILIPCLALGMALFLMLAKSDVFWERAGTIGNTNTETMDNSAASRLVVAKANLQMFLDHPFGLGHRGNEYASAGYLPDSVLTTNTSGRQVRSGHNTVLVILADHGLPGIVLFVLLTAWAGRRLLALRRFDAHGLSPQLAGLRASVGAALIGALVCGLFVNLLKAEVSVWMLAMLASLNRVSLASVTRVSGVTATGKSVPVEVRAQRPPAPSLARGAWRSHRA